jgi:hypothetical protein
MYTLELANIYCLHMLLQIWADQNGWAFCDYIYIPCALDERYVYAKANASYLPFQTHPSVCICIYIYIFYRSKKWCVYIYYVYIYIIIYPSVFSLAISLATQQKAFDINRVITSQYRRPSCKRLSRHRPLPDESLHAIRWRPRHARASESSGLGWWVGILPVKIYRQTWKKIDKIMKGYERTRHPFNFKYSKGDQ